MQSTDRSAFLHSSLIEFKFACKRLIKIVVRMCVYWLALAGLHHVSMGCTVVKMGRSAQGMVTV